MSVMWLLQQQKQRPGSVTGSVLWRVQHQKQRPGTVTGASCGSCSSRSCVWERYRSVLWLLLQQKQRPGALQERLVAPAAAETALQERCRGVLQAPAAGEGAFGSGHRSVTGAGCRGVAESRSVAGAQDQERCSVRERCRSVAGAGLVALQRPGALQERCRDRISDRGRIGDVAGTLQVHDRDVETYVSLQETQQ